MMNLIQLIQHFEGCRLAPYKDTMGLLTIGWGRCLDRKGVSQAEADLMLSNDIAAVRNALTGALPWIATLDQARQDVLFCMAFQLGTTGLLQFTHMLEAVKSGDWDKAVHEMLDSQWHKQTPARAEELANILLNG